MTEYGRCWNKICSCDGVSDRNDEIKIRDNGDSFTIRCAHCGLKDITLVKGTAPEFYKDLGNALGVHALNERVTIGMHGDGGPVVSKIVPSQRYIQEGNTIMAAPQVIQPVALMVEDARRIENNIKNNNSVKEEKKTMMNLNNIFKGFEMGSLAGDNNYRVSHLGVAIKNASGTFVAFDKKKQEIIDVDFFDLDMNDLIYKMPVAANQVVVGDTIVHNNTPMIVTGKDGRDLKTIDPVQGERKIIMPTKSSFGFDFFTKITPLIDFSNMTGDNDNPFATLAPLMMMKGGDSNDMLPLMMMMSGGNMGNMMQNPMMLMMMMGGKGEGKNDMMSTMMMMSMMGGGASPFANMFGAQPQPQPEAESTK